LARELGLPYAYLAHLSNTYLEDLHGLDVAPERVEAAFAALRRVLTGTVLSWCDGRCGRGCTGVGRWGRGICRGACPCGTLLISG
jgi:hypothetical protein